MFVDTMLGSDNCYIRGRFHLWPLSVLQPWGTPCRDDPWANSSAKQMSLTGCHVWCLCAVPRLLNPYRGGTETLQFANLFPNRLYVFMNRSLSLFGYICCIPMRDLVFVLKSGTLRQAGRVVSMSGVAEQSAEWNGLSSRHRPLSVLLNLSASSWTNVKWVSKGLRTHTSNNLCLSSRKTLMMAT